MRPRVRLRMAAFVLAVAVLSLCFPRVAEAKYASLVMDADTGRVLHAVNADTRNYPASLTKMMTLYMVFDALERGEITMNTRWTASARVARQPASKLGLGRGQSITVHDAIYALITKSANDVASLVGEGLAKSERDFALAMTARARKLGMNSTTFRNASGLPNRGQLSTARDMAVLALALIRDHSKYYSMFATAKFEYEGRTFKNHNKLLASYQGTDGIKTGYIRASGFNLVASVKRDGRRLIGVVFGGDSSRKRNRHMITLLDKGFALLDNELTVASAAPADIKPALASVVSNEPTVVKLPAHLSWGIQVGAFKQKVLAGQVAHEASAIVPKIMGTGFVTVVPFKKQSGEILYRSRIHGITKKQAYRACKVLKKRKMGCMEVRLPKGQQLAYANDG